MSWILEYKEGNLVFKGKEKTREEKLNKAITEMKAQAFIYTFVWALIGLFFVLLIMVVPKPIDVWRSFSISKQIGLSFAGIILFIIGCTFFVLSNTSTDHKELLSFLKKEGGKNS